MPRAGARRNGNEQPESAWNGNSRRPLGVLLGLAVLTSCAGSAAAASPMQATSSRAAREDAIRSVPLDKLEENIRPKVTATLSNATIYRRLPIQVIDCDPDLYLFLVRHPEVIVGIWEVMKISNVALERTGPDTFRASDGAGTLCQVKFCYSNHETQVIYAEGSYDGPLFSRPVRAKCVLVLKSGYMQETNGRHYVTSRMDTFIQIDHVGVEILAKTLQPLVHRSADYNFVETAGFLGTVSRAAELNAAGMQRLAGKLPNLEPEVRQRFVDLSIEVGKKAVARDGLQASAAGPLTEAAPKRATLERR
ncbi:MAG: hypothetical protein HY288_17085 [Planctomycetia bacterium]|nr:hypothetical protein [Planctomycetia bacterium]